MMNIILSIAFFLLSSTLTPPSSLQQVATLKLPSDESIYATEQYRYWTASREYGLSNDHSLMLATFAPPSSLVEKQIKILDQVLAKAENDLTVDEALRWQLWSLGESLHYGTLYGNLSSDTLGSGIKTLQRALARYLEIRNQIAEKLVHIKKEAPTEIQEVVELALKKDQLIEYAENLENLVGLSAWPKDKERCGTTARALLYYFSHKHNLGQGIQTALHQPQYKAETLMYEIVSHSTDAENTFVYLVDSVRYDHVFILLQKQETFYLLQSFVGEYSLAAEIAEVKPMDLNDTLAFLLKIQSLDQSADWTEQIDGTFEELFHARAPTVIQKKLSEEKPDFRFATLAYKK